MSPTQKDRRQDVYDIAFLLDAHPMTDEDRSVIHGTLIEKCATRDMHPDATSLKNPEVVRRAEAEWQTLALEVQDLPPFADRFAIVLGFYVSLPWGE